MFDSIVAVDNEQLPETGRYKDGGGSGFGNTLALADDLVA